MSVPRWACLLPVALIAALPAGCAPPETAGGAAAAPSAASPAPPPAPLPASLTATVDTVGSIPGSPNALYVYRFKLTEPGGAGFTFRDRDLSFYFRPAPSALYFRVENLQGRPVTIDWDRSVFYDPLGRTGKVAHGTTQWRDRFNPQALTTVPGQQQYGDYVFPMDDLVDPGTSDQQLRQPLLPEDASAPTYNGATFGVDLVFNVEDRPRTYPFRFQVAAVTPR
ncbi:MAG TPA: hypothetical protein VGU27_10820 [Candidatus Eisenbacteria bacterium]|nr:hypothetical protein [Candidatus Eisenbacteria bacterium]